MPRAKFLLLICVQNNHIYKSIKGEHYKYKKVRREKNYNLDVKVIEE